MLIFSPHNLNLCLDSQETRFLWNIFEAVQNPRSRCFIGIKTRGYTSCFYTPIKHCCSFFKHYIMPFVFVKQKLSQLVYILVLVFPIKLRVKERRKGERTVFIKKTTRLLCAKYVRTLDCRFSFL